MQFFSPVSKVFTNLRQAVTDLVIENPTDDSKRLPKVLQSIAIKNNHYSESIENKETSVIIDVTSESEDIDDSSYENSCTSEPTCITPNYQEDIDFNPTSGERIDGVTPTVPERYEQDFETDSQHYETVYENNIDKSDAEESDIDRTDAEDDLVPRESELIRIRERRREYDKLDSLLNDWVQQSDRKLNQILAQGFDSNTQMILEDIKNDIPNWQQKLNVYQEISHDLSSMLSLDIGQEEIDSNLERVTQQWCAVLDKLARCSSGISPINKMPSKLKIHDVKEADSSTTNEIRNEFSSEKLSGWLSSLEGQLETIEMGMVRWRSGSGSLAAAHTDKLKLKVTIQVNEMLNDIKQYENQYQTYSDSECNIAEYQISSRWKIFKEKVNKIRRILEASSENSRQLLKHLNQLNDWLAHKEADLTEIKESPSNCYGLALGQLERFENLLGEIKSRHSQIEDTIDESQGTIGEVIDLDTPLELFRNQSVESEGDSDTSDTSSGINDDKNKRLVRRLRRHLYHLKRKWIEINFKTKDFHAFLKRKVQLFETLKTLMEDSDRSLSELEFQLDSWGQVANISSSSMPREIEQVKALLESTQQIADKFHSIDSHIKEMDTLTIAPNNQFLDNFQKSNSRLASIRSLCATRLDQLQEQQQSSMKRVPSSDIKESFSRDESMNSIPDPINSSRDVLENRNPSSSVSYPWERCLHPTGSEVPYYKNHSTQATQWDHPIMTELIKSYDTLNAIRFSAYRTAMKLRALQRTLCLDLIDLRSVGETLRMSGLLCATTNDRLLDIGHVIRFLASMYQTVNTNPGQTNTGELSDQEKINMSSQSLLGCTRKGSIRDSLLKNKKQRIRCNSFSGFNNNDDDKDGGGTTTVERRPSISSTSQSPSTKFSETTHVTPTRKELSNGTFEINIPVCVDLALNFLLNVYDSARNGKIRVLSMKTAIVIMANACLEDKYKYLFSLMCNSYGQIDPSQLSALLTDCILIPKHLNESSNFSLESVTPCILSCFQNSIVSGPNRFIRLSHFLSWLKLEPQSLVWLPVLHRLISAESAVHQTKCGVCKTQPMIGLRYRCLRCFNFDLCQACFFYSKTDKGHKVSHPMQEYRNVTSSKENIRDYSRILRNQFRSKSRIKELSKPSYLPVQNPSKNDRCSPSMQANANPLCRSGSLSAPPTDMIMGFNGVILSRNNSGRIMDLNRKDEEHILISKYTDMLRIQMRRDSAMITRNVLNVSTFPKLSINSSMDNIKTMPSVFNCNSSPLNKNLPSSNLLPEMREASPSIGMTPRPMTNDNSAARNGKTSLNSLINGLESQKRQLLEEYELLRSQSPVNYSSAKVGYVPGDQEQRYSPFNQNPTSIGSRNSCQPYSPFLHRRGLDISETNPPASSNLASEARMLREHKYQLENRMSLLEDRNRQLENQLNTLRQLIGSSPSTVMLPRPSIPNNNTFSSDNCQTEQDFNRITSIQYSMSKIPNVRLPYSSPNVAAYDGQMDVSNLYGGPKRPAISGVYSSLEKNVLFGAPFGINTSSPSPRTTIDKSMILQHPSTSYTSYQQLRNSKGSLSDSDFQSISRGSTEQKQIIPPMFESEHPTNSIGSLFQMADQVGKAVGQLVNVMSEDFSNVNHDPASVRPSGSLVQISSTGSLALNNNNNGITSDSYGANNSGKQV